MHTGRHVVGKCFGSVPHGIAAISTMYCAVVPKSTTLTLPPTGKGSCLAARTLDADVEVLKPKAVLTAGPFFATSWAHVETNVIYSVGATSCDLVRNAGHVGSATETKSPIWHERLGWLF